MTPRILLATPAALLVMACSATEPNAMHPVSLAAAIAGGPTAGGVTRDLVVAGQGRSISISTAQMMLSRIELASNQSCASSASFSNQSDDDGDSSDVDNDDGDSSDSSDVENDDGESSDSSDVDNDDGDSSDSSDVDDDDGESSDSSDVDNDSPGGSICAPLTGQVLVSLPLDGTTKGIADALVPAGTYTRLQANLQTVKVVGVYTDANGTTRQFTLTPRLNVVSAIRLNAPVTVNASTINLILDVGVRSWFTDRSGAVLDPTSAANQRAVERNILRSLRARS